MNDSPPVDPIFDYDDDPEIRAIEQQLERPALFEKAARAQARARRRMRFRWLAGAAVAVGVLLGGWKLWQREFPPKKAKPELQKSSPPPVPPDTVTAPVEQRTDPILPEKETSPTPGPGPKKPPPPVATVVEPRAADFPPAFRPAVEAIQSGRIETAGQRLAMLEKSAVPVDEVRALDEDEEAKLDTLAFLKGLVFLKARRFSEAAAQFSRLDEAGKPWRVEAQFYLYQAYFLLGKEREAAAFFEKISRSGDGRILKMAEAWRAQRGR